MAIFESTEKMYEVLGTLFNKLLADPTMGPKFTASDIIIRFEIFEPFRGEGLSYKMMYAFLNLIDRDEVSILPMKKELYGFYRKLGFKKKFRSRYMKWKGKR